MNKKHLTPGMMAGMGPTYPNGTNPNFMNRPASGRPQYQLGTDQRGNNPKQSIQMRHPNMMPPKGINNSNNMGERIPMQPRLQPVRQIYRTGSTTNNRIEQPDRQSYSQSQPHTNNPEDDKLRYLLVYHSNVQQSINFRDKVMKSPVFQKITIKPVDANDPEIRKSLSSEVKNVPTLVGMRVKDRNKRTFIHPHQVEEWLRLANEKYGNCCDLPGYEADPFSDNFCELSDSTMTLDPTIGTKINHKNDRFVSFDQTDTLIIDPHDTNAIAPTRNPPRENGGIKRPQISNKFSSDQFNELQKEYEQKRNIPATRQQSHNIPSGTNFPQPIETREAGPDMTQLMNKFQMERDKGIPKPPDRTGMGGGSNNNSIPPNGTGRHMGYGMAPNGINIDIGNFGNHSIDTKFQELSKQYKQ